MRRWTRPPWSLPPIRNSATTRPVVSWARQRGSNSIRASWPRRWSRCCKARKRTVPIFKRPKWGQSPCPIWPKRSRSRGLASSTFPCARSGCRSDWRTCGAMRNWVCPVTRASRPRVSRTSCPRLGNPEQTRPYGPLHTRTRCPRHKFPARLLSSTIPRRTWPRRCTLATCEARSSATRLPACWNSKATTSFAKTTSATGARSLECLSPFLEKLQIQVTLRL